MKNQELLGKAFLCADGLIRWIVYCSARRNLLHTYWRDPESDIWHAGGKSRISDFEHTVEVPAPQPGEDYKIFGAMGELLTRRHE